MATKITETNELQITLTDASGAFGRTIRINDPVDGVTLAQIRTALAPAINSHTTADSDSAIVPFFYDDNSDEGLTVVAEAQRVRIQKSVTPIA